MEPTCHFWSRHIIFLLPPYLPCYVFMYLLYLFLSTHTNTNIKVYITLLNFMWPTSPFCIYRVLTWNIKNDLMWLEGPPLSFGAHIHPIMVFIFETWHTSINCERWTPFKVNMTYTLHNWKTTWTRGTSKTIVDTHI